MRGEDIKDGEGSERKICLYKLTSKQLKLLLRVAIEFAGHKNKPSACTKEVLLSVRFTQFLVAVATNSQPLTRCRHVR
jgi:hypothetical protein